jgi:membrane-associated phospholipid phosphatase
MQGRAIAIGLLAALAIFGAFVADAPVRSAIVENQGKKWRKSADYRFHASVRRYGDWPELMAVGAIGLVVAWRMRRREWSKILAAAMIASTLAGIIANASRVTTGRTRPRESPKIEQGFYGPIHQGRLTIGNPAYNSFPSGHTATAFGFAAPILYARPWLGVGALVVAGVIGWSSIAIGAHHPSDVVTSIALSLLVGWFVWEAVRTRGDKAWAWLRQRLRRRAPTHEP